MEISERYFVIMYELIVNRIESFYKVRFLGKLELFSSNSLFFIIFVGKIIYLIIFF